MKNYKYDVFYLCTLIKALPSSHLCLLSEIKLLTGNSCGSFMELVPGAICWSAKCIGLYINSERGAYGMLFLTSSNLIQDNIILYSRKIASGGCFFSHSLLTMNYHWLGLLKLSNAFCIELF